LVRCDEHVLEPRAGRPLKQICKSLPRVALSRLPGDYCIADVTGNAGRKLTRIPQTAQTDHAAELAIGNPVHLCLPIIAKRIVVGDLPHCGLLAVTLPVASLALSHSVPAGFMAPNEPSVPLPRARLVVVRRPYYSDCIKLSYRVRPVHLDFSQNPALLTSCQ
jgi:hypothetical protein